MSLEERVERLEEFIGDISAIKVYASTLQGIVDRYLTPLYIDANTSGSELLINDYLGDIDNIPHNILFNVRATHDLDMTGATDATIRFKNGDKEATYTLRRISSVADVDDDVDDEGYVEKKLVSGSYSRGINYNIYIKSDDIAIISSNDTGVRAMEIATENNAAITALQTFINKINKSEADDGTITYTFDSNIISNKDITSSSIKANDSLTFGDDASAVVLPEGSTISGDTSSFTADTDIPNVKYVNETIESKINTYDTTKHLVGTTDAETYMQDKDNGSLYFKLGS